MYDAARGDPLFYALLEIAVRVFGAAIGAFLGALTLKLATRLVAHFWPGYWKSYRTVFFAGAVTITVHYAIARLSAGLDIAVYQLVIPLLIGFGIHLLFYRRMLEQAAELAIGWLKTSAVCLIQAAFFYLAWLGYSALDQELAAGGKSFFLPHLRAIFDIKQAPWMNQDLLIMAAAVVLVAAHILLLLRRRAEPSWLASAVLAAALIPYGFGLMLIASQLFSGILAPAPEASGFASQTWMTAGFAAARQASLWTGCAAILILVTGRLAIHLRRHRLLTAMHVGPAIPPFFWVLGLPLLAISGSLFIHFLLEQSFLGIVTGASAASLLGRVNVIRLLSGIHFLGLFTIATGVALVAVAHWRAGRGLGKAPWLLLGAIIFLLLLSGGNIFFSLYRYSVFIAN